MTSRDFVYWLQGYFELMRADKNVPQALSYQQTDCIEKHLNMVFKHEIDPSHGDAAHQKVLSDAHRGIAGTQVKGILDGTQSLINC